MQFEDEIANISRVSLVTPVRRFGAIPPSASGICTLIAHGLGSDNPKNKSHLLDSWVDLIGRGIRATEKKDATFISYTARGHGDSNGWEDSASDNPDQFTWRHLYTDMVAVAEFYQIPKFIASGSSMGSGEKTKRQMFYCYHWNTRLTSRSYLYSDLTLCGHESPRQNSSCHNGSPTNCMEGATCSEEIPFRYLGDCLGSMNNMNN